MARRKSEFGPNLGSILQGAPAALVRQFLASFKRPDDTLLAPPEITEGTTNDQGKAALSACVLQVRRRRSCTSGECQIDSPKRTTGNPDARIFGVTATPNRGDKKGLREVFDNVADQVRLGELIASGHLVPPRTFVIDVGVQDELRSVRKTLSDFDMAEVAGIMDRAPVTDEVIRHWTEKAGDRQTVIFCSTVAHAEHVTEAFSAAGITAALIHGDLASDTRKAILADYAAGSIRVIVNVAVLTEGWDHPPTQERRPRRSARQAKFKIGAESGRRLLNDNGGL